MRSIGVGESLSHRSVLVGGQQDVVQRRAKRSGHEKQQRTWHSDHAGTASYGYTYLSYQFNKGRPFGPDGIDYPVFGPCRGIQGKVGEVLHVDRTNAVAAVPSYGEHG